MYSIRAKKYNKLIGRRNFNKIGNLDTNIKTIFYV